MLGVGVDRVARSSRRKWGVAAARGLVVELAQRWLAVPVDRGCDQTLRQLEALARHAAQAARFHLHLVLHFEQVVVNEYTRQRESL